MVFNKNFVLSVFSIISLFGVVPYQLNGFLLAYCACSHLAPAISAMLASMCQLLEKLSSKILLPGITSPEKVILFSSNPKMTY